MFHCWTCLFCFIWCGRCRIVPGLKISIASRNCEWSCPSQDAICNTFEDKKHGILQKSSHNCWTKTLQNRSLPSWKKPNKSHISCKTCTWKRKAHLRSWVPLLSQLNASTTYPYHPYYMVDIFAYIYDILPLNTTKRRKIHHTWILWVM